MASTELTTTQTTTSQTNNSPKKERKRGRRGGKRNRTKAPAEGHNPATGVYESSWICCVCGNINNNEDDADEPICESTTCPGKENEEGRQKKCEGCTEFDAANPGAFQKGGTAKMILLKPKKKKKGDSEAGK